MADSTTDASEDKVVLSGPDVPKAAAAYSSGLIKGGLLQVAGQGPADPATGAYVTPDDIGNQTTQTLRNVAAVLAAGGASFEDVLMMRVYLTVREHFAPMNEAYAAFLAEHVPSGAMPARTTIFCTLGSDDMLIEIDALAAVG